MIIKWIKKKEFTYHEHLSQDHHQKTDSITAWYLKLLMTKLLDLFPTMLWTFLQRLKFSICSIYFRQTFKNISQCYSKVSRGTLWKNSIVSVRLHDTSDVYGVGLTPPFMRNVLFCDSMHKFVQATCYRNTLCRVDTFQLKSSIDPIWSNNTMEAVLVFSTIAALKLWTKRYSHLLALQHGPSTHISRPSKRRDTACTTLLEAW